MRVSKNCLSILAVKIDELNDINNFLSRNNNIILKRIASLEKVNKDLNKKLKYFQNDLYDFTDELYYTQCETIKNSQYSRRESLIITGIPNNISQRNLEPTCLKIIQSLGLRNVSSYEVVACHRLSDKINDGKYSQKTIIRFTNRKVVDFCLKNRKNHHIVKEKTGLNVRLYENLCEKNEYIFRECKRLKKAKVIEDCYITNGYVKLIKKNGDNPLKVHHPDDLYNHFYEFYDQKDSNGNGN